MFWLYIIISIDNRYGKWININKCLLLFSIATQNWWSCVEILLSNCLNEPIGKRKIKCDLYQFWVAIWIVHKAMQKKQLNSLCPNYIILSCAKVQRTLLRILNEMVDLIFYWNLINATIISRNTSIQIPYIFNLTL